MYLSSFYDQFHKKAKPQKKIISENNFTYLAIIKIFKKLFKEGEKLSILDYACGVGTLGLYLANLGNRIIGLDVSPLVIRIANKSAKLTSLDKLAKFYIFEPGGKIKFSEKFDLIICIESGFQIRETYKTEGIIKNSLFLFQPLGILIKFIRGPITKIVTFFDNPTIPFLGESDIFILAQKI